MTTLHTFGDSVLACQRYNALGYHPAQMMARNDDLVYPEWANVDLDRLNEERTHLSLHAADGQTARSLPDPRSCMRKDDNIALLTIGGNDLLSYLSPFSYEEGGLDEFYKNVNTFLARIPCRTYVGNVYDPTFGATDGAALTKLLLSISGLDSLKEVTMANPSVTEAMDDMAVKWRKTYEEVNALLADAVATNNAVLVDLQAHFARGSEGWFTRGIEPSLVGVNEVRRCFMAALLNADVPTWEFMQREE